MNLKARYQIFDENIISSYNKAIEIEGIEDFIKEEFKSSKIEKLRGGYISSVFKIQTLDGTKVVKICQGTYRISELKREGKILKELGNSKHCKLVPKYISYKELDDKAYLLEDFVEGSSTKDDLINKDIDSLKVWYKAGELLNNIHSIEYNYLDTNWLNGQLKLAKLNMDKNILDPEEFINTSPEIQYQYLIDNKLYDNELSLLHGDFRIKNIISNKVIDWGFVDVGSPYYDLAIIDYYFRNKDERKSFYKGYSLKKYNKDIIKYYDILSKFINV